MVGKNKVCHAIYVLGKSTIIRTSVAAIIQLSQLNSSIMIHNVKEVQIRDILLGHVFLNIMLGSSSK